jgi:hypothetical protein
MSREKIVWIIGTLGLLVAAPLLLASDLVESKLADVSTESALGTGVDVRIIDRYPLAGESVSLHINARGGRRVAIEQIEISQAGVVLTRTRARGASWGRRFYSSSKHRGHKALTVTITPQKPTGLLARLAIKVAYVCAISTGNSRFKNKRFSASLALPLRVYSPSDRLTAKAWDALLLLGRFLLWSLLCFALAWLLKRIDNSSADISTDASEHLGIGLLIGLIGAGFVGHWFFSRPLLALIGLADQAVAKWASTAVWVIVPPVLAYLLAPRQSALRSYQLTAVPCHQKTAPYRGAEINELPRVPAEQLRTFLEADGFECKSSASTLRGTGSGMRIKIALGKQTSAALDKLVVRSTDLLPVVQLCHRLIERYGPLQLETPDGPIELDGSKAPDEVVLDQLKIKLAALNIPGLHLPKT